MADQTITITVKDADTLRVANAFDGLFTGRTDGGYTKAQWVKVILVQHTKRWVRQWEVRQASIVAEQAAGAVADADVS